MKLYQIQLTKEMIEDANNSLRSDIEGALFRKSFHGDLSEWLAMEDGKMVLTASFYSVKDDVEDRLEEVFEMSHLREGYGIKVENEDHYVSGSVGDVIFDPITDKWFICKRFGFDEITPLEV